MNKIISKGMVIVAIIIAIMILREQKCDPMCEAVNGTIVTIDSAAVKVLFPEFTKATKRKENIQIYDIFNVKNSLLGQVISSQPFSDSIRGYAGDVPYYLGVDKSGKIIGLELLEHNETPGFITLLNSKKFFNNFDGLTLKEAAAKNVDIITGATFTTQAVISSSAQLLGLLTKTNSKLKKQSTLFSITNVAALMVLLSALIIFFYAPARKFRVYHLILSVVVLGGVSGMFLSVYLFESWILNGIDFKTMLLPFIIMLISVLIPLILDKSFYCTSLCPYGAAQELIGITGRKLGIKKLKVTPKIVNLRTIILFIIFVLVAMGFITDSSAIEPFSAFLIMSATVPILIFAGLFLILSLFLNKPWCTLFCPTGEIFERLRKPLRLK